MCSNHTDGSFHHRQYEVVMSEELNVNINGGNIGGVQLGGSGNTQHITQNNEAESEISLELFLSKLQENLPQEERPKVDPEVIDPIKELASQELPDSPEEQQTLKEKIVGYLKKLEPYTPYLRKTLAAFTEGALKTLPPPASWVIGGALEVCKQERQD